MNRVLSLYGEYLNIKHYNLFRILHSNIPCHLLLILIFSYFLYMLLGNYACAGHNFPTLKAMNLKIQTLIEHVMEKCSEHETLLCCSFIFMPPYRKMGGAYCFTVVCLSVGLSVCLSAQT